MNYAIMSIDYYICQETLCNGFKHFNRELQYLSADGGCLRSVFASETEYTYEVILIDNNSKDESVQTIRELFPQVKLIENTENTGFAKANNQGMEVRKVAISR